MGVFTLLLFKTATDVISFTIFCIFLDATFTVLQWLTITYRNKHFAIMSKIIGSVSDIPSLVWILKLINSTSCNWEVFRARDLLAPISHTLFSCRTCVSQPKKSLSLLQFPLYLSSLLILSVSLICAGWALHCCSCSDPNYQIGLRYPAVLIVSDWGGNTHGTHQMPSVVCTVWQRNNGGQRMLVKLARKIMKLT